MEVIAWCIMTNHIHFIFRSIAGQHPALLLRDFKRFTSKKLVKAIRDNPLESRKEYLLNQVAKAGKKASNVNSYQFWRQDNKPIEIWNNKVIHQKVNYIHNNPVKAGIVVNPDYYLYSSARIYADEKGILQNVVLFEYYG